MTLEIRPDKRTLALQLRDGIRELLRVRHLSAGEQIPSEESLVTIFGVSRATVREALKYLEEERVIVCRHGSGRYLAASPGSVLAEEITRLQSVTEMAHSLGIAITTRVIDLRVEAPSAEVRTHLQLESNGDVYILERVRLSQDQPVIYSVDIFPVRLLPQPPSSDQFTGSLLELLERAGARLEYAKSIIQAVRLEPEIAARLAVDPAAPWTLLEQVNYDRKDTPVLYSRDYHNAEKFQFRVLRRRR